METEKITYSKQGGKITFNTYRELQEYIRGQYKSKYNVEIDDDIIKIIIRINELEKTLNTEQHQRLQHLEQQGKEILAILADLAITGNQTNSKNEILKEKIAENIVVLVSLMMAFILIVVGILKFI